MPSLNLEPAIVSGITNQLPQIDKGKLEKTLSTSIGKAEEVIKKAIQDSLRAFAAQSRDEEIASLRSDFLKLQDTLKGLDKHFKEEVGEIKHDASEAVSSYRALKRTIEDINATTEAKMEVKMDDKVSHVAGYLIAEYEEQIDRLIAVQVSIWLCLSA